ncbi:hypothetical protein Tco_1478692, partial [Tanacetum coccineum]
MEKEQLEKKKLKEAEKEKAGKLAGSPLEAQLSEREASKPKPYRISELACSTGSDASSRAKEPSILFGVILP